LSSLVSPESMSQPNKPSLAPCFPTEVLHTPLMIHKTVLVVLPSIPSS
jgi:hypothetical protein